MRTFLTLSAINGFVAIALGAFAAHGLSGRLSPKMLQVFETGAEYQMTQGLALLGVAILTNQWPQSRALKISGWAFVLGLILFPFSLYLLALTGLGWLGAITPLGGLGFLVGWVALAVFAFKQV